MVSKRAIFIETRQYVKVRVEICDSAILEDHRHQKLHWVNAQNRKHTITTYITLYRGSTYVGPSETIQIAVAAIVLFGSGVNVNCVANAWPGSMLPLSGRISNT